MASIAVFGGSFDPVHQAHLIVAERVREALGLERVLFVPAHRQPLKGADTPAPGEERLRMLRLALADNPAFEVSALELERGGTSYTVETLRELARLRPAARLFLVLGSDAWALAARWRDFDEVQRLARVVVVSRPAPPPVAGPEPRASGVHGPEPLRVEVPALEISATEISARVARGASIRYLVPEPVRAHIVERGLYRGPAPRSRPPAAGP
jgi:nicotinate-nucleotide adenylyltransferase